MVMVMNIIIARMMTITLNSQVKLFRLQSEDAKERIFTNTANAMDGVSKDVKVRHIRHCYKADPEYGKGVAKALDFDINQIDLETNQDETYENF